MSKAAAIPMPGDVAELIGPMAQRVENRSLLLDKFVFHKKWPVVEEMTRKGPSFVKWDEASRWSFMRIADGASQILNRDAAEKRRRAGGRNVEPANKDRFNAEAMIASTLANVTWDSAEVDKLRSRHTRRFIGLFRRANHERTSTTIGQLEGRLAINLADSLIQNSGICLDRLFGLPYVPGSAVKGVCRHAALDELCNASENTKPELFKIFCAVFGTSESDFKSGDLTAFNSLLQGTDPNQKGTVAFLPAYPVNEAKIVVDLTNVHYPDYYHSGHEADQSRERPQPNPFPAVESGAQFAFCLVLNSMSEDPNLLRAATRWLHIAITERGLGAKTASGYGWFSIQDQVLQSIEEEERLEAEAAAAKRAAAREKVESAMKEAQRRQSLSPQDLASEDLLKLRDEDFALFAKEISAKEELMQRAFCNLLLENKEKRQRWKTWRKKKPDLANGIREVADKLNIKLP